MKLCACATGGPRPLHFDSVRRVAGAQRGGVLDARPAVLAQRGHLPGSAWLPVADPSDPGRDLPSTLLPPRGEPIAVIAADPDTARAIAAHLCARGYEAGYLDGPLPATALKPGLSGGALWRADAWLRRSADLLPPPGAGPIADLGGGSGRNSVWLARRGYRALVVDRLPDALDLARDRASRHRVTIETFRADLRRPGALRGRGPFAAALLIRFLLPQVLDELPELLLPDGIVILRCFHVPDPGASAMAPGIAPATELGRAPGAATRSAPTAATRSAAGPAPRAARSTAPGALPGHVPAGALPRPPRTRHGLPVPDLLVRFNRPRWELLLPPTAGVEGGHRLVGLVARLRG